MQYSIKKGERANSFNIYIQCKPDCRLKAHVIVDSTP